MKLTIKHTKQVLFIGMIVLGVYDFGVFAFTGTGSTVSQVMTDYFHVSPFGCGVVFMILGHFLWPMTVNTNTSRLKVAWKNWNARDGDYISQADLNDAISELVDMDQNPLRYFRRKK